MLQQIKMSALLTVLLHFSAIIVILCTSEPEVLNNDVSIKILTDSDSPCPPTELCLTLEEFRKNASQYSLSDISLTLEFLPGDHILTAPVIFNDISNLTLLSRTENANIICFSKSNHAVHFQFSKIAIGELTRLTFLGCGLNDYYVALKIINSSNLTIKENMVRDSKGLAVKAPSEFSNITLHKSKFSNSFEPHNILQVFKSRLSIAECKFHDSEGTFVYADHSNITVYKSIFFNSSGRVFDAKCCNVTDVGSLYYNNSLSPHTSTDSVVHSYSSVFNLIACNFCSNGALFMLKNTTIALNFNEMINNTTPANSNNALLDVHESNVMIKNSYIKENIGRYGILMFENSPILLRNVTIIGNNATFGQVLSVSVSKFRLKDNILQDIYIAHNNGENTIIFSESKVTVARLMFSNNSGTFLITTSDVNFTNTVLFQHSKASIATSNSSKFPIGVLTSMGSNIWFYDSVEFINNYSKDVGGGLCAKLYIFKSILLYKNQAKKSGSGIYLFKSTFLCIKSCNISENRVTEGKGGGIYAFDSSIVLGIRNHRYINTVLFVIKGNFATKGGGMYLAANSRLIIPKETHRYTLIFENNNADIMGQVLYIDDDTYPDICEQYVPCFLQVSLPTLPSESDSQGGQIQISGEITKTAISGGFLYKCFVSDKFISNKFTSGIDYLKTMTNDQNISRLITSKAVRILSESKTTTVHVKKGEQFTVRVCALDQVNHKIKAKASINFKSGNKSQLERDQHSQLILAECSNLSFNAYSLYKTETLYIYPESHCSNYDN